MSYAVHPPLPPSAHTVVPSLPDHPGAEEGVATADQLSLWEGLFHSSLLSNTVLLPDRGTAGKVG